MLAIISFIVAASLSGVSAKCAAMPQVQECVQTTTTYRIAVCGPNDYQCQCDGYSYISACFLPCNGDAEVTQMAQRFDGLKQNLCTSASLTSKAPEATSKGPDPSTKSPEEINDTTKPKPSSPASKPDSPGKPSSAFYNYVPLSSVAIVAMFLIGQ